MVRLIALVGLLVANTIATAQQILPYKDPSLPVEARVKDLMSRMTPEEKFWQCFMIPGDLNNTTPDQYKHGLFGFQVSAATQGAGATQQMLQYNTGETMEALVAKVNAIQKYFVEQSRLGIPIIVFDETLHGLVRKGATSFPQAIGLAASFDSSLMYRVANAIAAETKQRGIRQVLSPVINIASDVRWGRTEESYGEDPVLTSAMAVAFVRAFEQAGIITTPKHFLANVGDGGRDSYPIHFSERYLKEVHLPPFKAAFQQAGAGSVMTSYNSIDGSPATASKWLLQDLLKKEYGFNGFVISDASAVGGANVLHFTATDYADASRRAMQNGLDVIFQTDYEHYKLFIPPFLNDSISKERIDDAVARVLTAKFKLGLFEHPYVETGAKNAADMQANRALAKEAAGKTFVLLQNKNSILPLSSNTKSIAVFGEDATAGRLGGYSGPGNNVVSILQGLQAAAGNTIKINYALGASRENHEWKVVADTCLFTDATQKQQGWRGSYFKNVSLSGKPEAERIDKKIDFHWTLYGPDNLQVNQDYSVQWQGVLKSPVSGKYNIGLEGNDGYRMYINKKLVIDRWQKQSYKQATIPFVFEKNKLYEIKVEFYEPVGNAHLKLIWNAGASNAQKQIEEAVALAKQSDVCIIAAGITEGEFQDRAMLSLPGKQEALIKAVAATGKPVIVLLVAGSAVTMQNWMNDVAGIVQVWYPGEAGGEAVADMLLGKINPAGRLPITVPMHEAQLPLVYNHKPTGRGDDYNNLSGQPLFPFGYGLSYTQFAYSNLQIHAQPGSEDSMAIISCDIKNIGTNDGDEVVQLYVHDELASVARPVMELKNFKRIHLKKGESAMVRFVLSKEALKLYNENMQWVFEPGDFRIMLGSSSRDIRLQRVVEF
ncbi:MAG TPA: glycoside hydrolase family 3 N-terminal domain-containing protein [Phnomibacter sp.]|nr:glycoside hydrolase family 3 N-terminal domain-containing protein [Phnomibacter sp.]